MVELRGRLERVAFDGGAWFVGKVRGANGLPLTIKGPTPDGTAPRVGSDLTLEGDWKDDGRFGRQFVFRTISARPPADREGVIGYLETMPGIGPKTAESLWEKHRENAISELLRDPAAALDGIKGTARKIEEISVAIRADADNASLKQTLFSYGIGAGRQRRIVEWFEKKGLDVGRVIDRNPYRLVDVPGVSFRAVDDGAMKTGRFREDSPFRAAAAIVFALEEAADKGHTWRTLGELDGDLSALRLATPIPSDVVKDGIAEAVKTGSVVRVAGMAGLAVARIAEDEDYNAARLIEILEAKHETETRIEA